MNAPAARRTAADLAEMFLARATVDTSRETPRQVVRLTTKQAAWLFDLAAREGAMHVSHGLRYADLGVAQCQEWRGGAAVLSRYLV